MKDDQPGLRMRMSAEARRVSSQHEQLNALYAGVTAALRTGVVKEARAAFQRFQDALEAHFTLEDQVFFPALHGLRPEFAVELRRLVREHRDLRGDLASVDRDLAASRLENVAEALSDFATLLAEHESREENVMQRITDRSFEGPD